ncbi:iron complex transport system ATP-binding protein [Panacagrimonas perspica]|uniref:Iron complex transport system ATP-binding protein n=1 Tax=Panacagrimonas perspica TaxID=381431 RepID=A0A4S3K0S9_9GAMM|nr:heme ABC transporter ATP-binding protein [Panacagrimonas perspica]TDU30702.1 iron complex transport system ATP-binding protein [Panacagrimonas perspica]THD01532.1 heme ABC transporter ATP-binding protein [Panacagrimonas perspica]
MLVAEGVSCVLDGRNVLRGVDLRLTAGEVLAILGPNGAGKSTLLRVLARENTPTSGRIELNGRALDQWSAVELARQRAVLPQADSLRFAFEVREVVRLGRYPWNGGTSDKEKQIVEDAMCAAGVEQFAARPYTSLSGGERARVQLARVLAQIWEAPERGTHFLLLDEPTASLDLAHQHEVLTAVRGFAARGAGVALALHDLNLATRYADRVLLMKDGTVDTIGNARDVLTAANIGRVFNVDVDLLRDERSEHPWIASRRRSSTT